MRIEAPKLMSHTRLLLIAGMIFVNSGCVCARGTSPHENERHVVALGCRFTIPIGYELDSTDSDPEIRYSDTRQLAFSGQISIGRYEPIPGDRQSNDRVEFRTITHTTIGDIEVLEYESTSRKSGNVIRQAILGDGKDRVIVTGRDAGNWRGLLRECQRHPAPESERRAWSKR